MKKQITTDKKGITLVSLIITIIVLLILAGVVINMTIGNDGIINKAQGAAECLKNAQEKEEYEIAKVEEDIDKYVGTSRDQKVQDYTTNMLYKTNYATMENGKKWSNNT